MTAANGKAWNTLFIWTLQAVIMAVVVFGSSALPKGVGGAWRSSTAVKCSLADTATIWPILSKGKPIAIGLCGGPIKLGSGWAGSMEY